jgi:hypothetical protein
MNMSDTDEWFQMHINYVNYAIHQNVGYLHISDASWALDQSYMQVLVLLFQPCFLFYRSKISSCTSHSELWPEDNSTGIPRYSALHLALFSSSALA